MNALARTLRPNLNPWLRRQKVCYDEKCLTATTNTQQSMSGETGISGTSKRTLLVQLPYVERRLLRRTKPTYHATELCARVR
ncbi:unnamed protein product [Lota lota]